MKIFRHCIPKDMNIYHVFFSKKKRKKISCRLIKKGALFCYKATAKYARFNPFLKNGCREVTNELLFSGFLNLQYKSEAAQIYSCSE